MHRTYVSDESSVMSRSERSCQLLINVVHIFEAEFSVDFSFPTILAALVVVFLAISKTIVKVLHACYTIYTGMSVSSAFFIIAALHVHTLNDEDNQ